MFKLFGGKKKNKGFYLELDESKESQPAPEAPTAALETTAVAEKEPEPAKAKAEKKTSIKKSAKKAKAAPAAKAPEPVAASTPSAATNGSKSEPQVVNFATDYLVVQTMSRRRPGPSLNPFKEMASQMKVPKTKA
jgi:peptidoglycan hydrolase CwlO-like protein